MDAQLIFEKVPTGRVHQVGGQYVPILTESGEPDYEYQLTAIIGGVGVPLLSLNAGYVEHWLQRPDAVRTPPPSPSSSGGTSASSAASQTEPGSEGAQPEPSAQAQG